MPLIATVITDVADLPEFSELDYEGWQTPYNPQLKHFRPALTTREENIDYFLKRRTKKLLENKPNYFMVKCTDTETNKMVGYATWELNDAMGPGEPVKATYHPEGSEEREFAEIFINGLWAFIGKRVTRPHMDLLGLVVHPDHRLRGAGRLLIRWGIDKADDLGVETVISSLSSARVAYERSGLGCIEKIPADESLNVKYPSKKWRELLDDDLSGWLMWRPIGHDYVEGVDKAPW